MENFLLGHETALRLGAFLGMFAIIAAWELAAPRRTLRESKALRWTHNLALTALNSVLVRAAFPVAAMGVAAFAAERGMGLLNIFPVPLPLAILLSVLALDLAIYIKHLMFHAVPLLGGCTGCIMRTSISMSPRVHVSIPSRSSCPC